MLGEFIAHVIVILIHFVFSGTGAVLRKLIQWKAPFGDIIQDLTKNAILGFAFWAILAFGFYLYVEIY